MFLVNENLGDLVLTRVFRTLVREHGYQHGKQKHHYQLEDKLGAVTEENAPPAPQQAEKLGEETGHFGNGFLPALKCGGNFFSSVKGPPGMACINKNVMVIMAHITTTAPMRRFMI